MTGIDERLAMTHAPTTSAPTTSAPTPSGPTQLQRIRTAVASAVAIGPGFLRGDVDADTMATTMLDAVRTYVAAEQADGRDGSPVDAASAQLYPVLQELTACGGGFLAGRCDADCVARTMTQLVGEFAEFAESAESA
jgi:hypothetical protein